MSLMDRLPENIAVAIAGEVPFCDGVFETDGEPRQEGDAWVLDVTDDEGETIQVTVARKPEAAPSDTDLAERAMKTADYFDAAGEGEIEAWSGGNFTTDDLRALAAGFSPVQVEVTDWEYARLLPSGNWFVPVLNEDDDLALPLVRRRKAGPWVKVTP